MLSAPLRHLGSALALLGLAACATGPADNAFTAASPVTPVVSADSIFDSALQCMDELLARTGLPKEVTLAPTELYDPTNKFGASTNDMIIAAALRMSERSRFFKVVEMGAQGTTAPQAADAKFIVRGSITAFDRAVTGTSASGGIDVDQKAQLGGRFQRQASVLTVSLRLQTRDGAVVPGSNSSVSIAIQQRSAGLDLTGKIAGLGGFGELEFDRAEGQHQALKTLVDLAMIQAVGNLTHVPYSRCLARPESDPASVQAARKAYDKLKDPERLSAIAEALRRRGFYSGPKAAAMTPDLRSAISAFMTSQGRAPTGLPTFEVFYALTGDQYGAPGAGTDGRAAAGPTPKIAPIGSNIYYGPTAGAFVAYARSRLSFSVTLAADGYLTCFYSDAHGRLTRVYPNPQQPAEFVPAGQPVLLPGPRDVFAIIAGADLTAADLQPGKAWPEYISCFAARQPIVPRLPAGIAPALSAQPLAAKGPSDLTAQIRAATGPALWSDILVYLVTNDRQIVDGPTTAPAAQPAAPGSAKKNAPAGAHKAKAPHH